MRKEEKRGVEKKGRYVRSREGEKGREEKRREDTIGAERERTQEDKEYSFLQIK